VPIVLVISYVIAYLAVIKTTKMAPIYIGAIIITMFTNIVIRAFGWRLMLIRNGPINWLLLKTGLIEQPFSLLFTDIAIILGLAHSIIPYAALLLISIMIGIDKTYVEVARVFGASEFRAFLHVTLPLSIPGLSGAFLIAMMWCLGVYTIPALLGSGGQITMTLAVEKQILSAFNWPFGTAIAMILILFTLVLLIAYFKVFRLNK
jgi:ABC-type spermidine/putrescine transport system permease subunit I